jgi:hypothetical protein
VWTTPVIYRRRALCATGKVACAVSFLDASTRPPQPAASRRRGGIAPGVWAFLLVAGCWPIALRDDTGLWLALAAVVTWAAAWAYLDLHRGRRLPVPAGRLGRDVSVSAVVGLAAGALTAVVWAAQSACLQDRAPDDPIGSCGGFVVVFAGPPALVGVCALVLALARVRRGAAVGVMAGPVGFGALQCYRAATHSGAQDPQLWTLAMIGALAVLVCWLAASPHHRPLLRLVGTSLAFVPLPLYLLVS